MMHKYTAEQKAAWLDGFDKRVASASIILEDADGRVLIVKAHYKDYWTFPGGMLDSRESPKQAAIREVFEEVGIKLDESTVTFAWIASRISRQLMTYQFVFKAVLSEPDKLKITLQRSEIEDSRLVSRDDVRANDLMYGKVIENWADGVSGYIEQTFGDV
jgi:8-oxo-dGTP pyrophosphatase MutT (NUDIX family)